MFPRKQKFHFHKISISRDRLLQTAHLQSRNLYSLGFSISIRSRTFRKINKDDQWLSNRSPIGNCERVIFKWSKQIVKYGFFVWKRCQIRSWMALSGIRQNIFLEIRRNYRAFNETQREILCYFLCSPFDPPDFFLTLVSGLVVSSFHSSSHCT